uniref:Bgt_avrF2_3 n=1 Tax=Blumeria graminis f. sp. tritici 96224 TaxID=1268274 RepID=A0A381LBT7_BLUGR
MVATFGSSDFASLESTLTRLRDNSFRGSRLICWMTVNFLAIACSFYIKNILAKRNSYFDCNIHIYTSWGLIFNYVGSFVIKIIRCVCS